MRERLNAIDLYKQQTNIKTSEDVFEIPHPPELQCEYIDNTKTQLETLCKSIEDIDIFLRGNDDLNDIKDNIEDIVYYNELQEACEYLEQFREAIENARYWGQEWKKFAKTMIDDFMDKDTELCIVNKKTNEEVTFEQLLEHYRF